MEEGLGLASTTDGFSLAGREGKPERKKRRKKETRKKKKKLEED